VFFIPSGWQQLGLDQRRDEMHLVGNIPEREEMIEQLRKFLQNVYKINPSGDFNRAPITQIKGLPYDLMALYLKGRG
jgi:predicted mannosyl-3-phosphoglycerate phosphatase (HAD superfamily)